MDLLTIILVICVVGVLLWLIHQLLPLDGTIRKILDLVVIGSLVLWLLKVFGVWAYLTKVHL